MKLEKSSSGIEQIQNKAGTLSETLASTAKLSGGEGRNWTLQHGLENIQAVAESAQTSVSRAAARFSALSLEAVAKAKSQLVNVQGSLSMCNSLLQDVSMACNIGASILPSDSSELEKLFKGTVDSPGVPSMLDQLINTLGSASYLAANSRNNLEPLFSEEEQMVGLVATAVQRPLDILAASSILPKGLDFDDETGTISGVPSVAAGRCDFTVTASNSSGHCSVTSALSVSNNGPPSRLSFPLFAALPGGTSQLLLVGDDITIDPDSGYLAGLPHAEISIKPFLPCGLSLDGATGKIYGNPKESAESTEYTVTATNVAGSCEFRMTFHVQEHLPPSFLTYSRELLIEGGPFHRIFICGEELSIAKPGTNGTHLTFVIDPALPSGVYLDESTGEILGEPDEVSERTEYIVSASNQKGRVQAKIVFSTSEMYNLKHGDEWSADQVTLFLEHDMVVHMKENNEQGNEQPVSKGFFSPHSPCQFATTAVLLALVAAVCHLEYNLYILPHLQLRIIMIIMNGRLQIRCCFKFIALLAVHV